MSLKQNGGFASKSNLFVNVKKRTNTDRGNCQLMQRQFLNEISDIYKQENILPSRFLEIVCEPVGKYTRIIIYNLKTRGKTVVFFVKNLASNATKRTRKVIMVILLGGALYFSNVQPSEAIGLSMPSVLVVRVYQPNYQYDSKVKIASVITIKKDLIVYQSPKEILFLMYLTDPKILVNQEVLKLVKEVRGGSWSLVGTAAVLGLIILIGTMGEGFVPNNLNPAGWGLDRPNPFQPSTAEHRYPPAYDLFFPKRTPGCSKSGSTLQINRPTAMPHQEFTDLTKAERRQLPHHHDIIIDVEGHTQLRVGFGQSRFKVGDHSAIHGLPYSVKANGGTKTEKSDENALVMMQAIEDMPHRPNVIWFEQDDVTYQGQTSRGFPAVHIFDDDTKIIAVFNKQTGNFVTTCQLSTAEETELKTTHNFGRIEDKGNRQAKNLPPQQTAVNTFESDVTGITPLSPMDENSSPGFTPTSSFESDVMGITPIDKSIDNP